jgi:hypothetical protein
VSEIALGIAIGVVFGVFAALVFDVEIEFEGAGDGKGEVGEDAVEVIVDEGKEGDATTFDTLDGMTAELEVEIGT